MNPLVLIAVVLITGYVLIGELKPTTDPPGTKRDMMGDVIVEDFKEIRYQDTDEYKRWIDVDRTTWYAEEAK